MASFRAHYPFESRYFEHAGLRQHYVDEGGGHPVLMLHGNPTWSFYYRELIERLRTTHRVIAPDHIGCGLSDKPGDDAFVYTLRSHVDRLERFVDHRGLSRGITLVLHDWGGAIGMCWALRHRDRIARVILLNTAAFPMPADRALPFLLRVVRTPGIGPLLVRGANAFARGATHLAVTRRRMPRTIRAAYCEPYDSWRTRIATLRMVQDIPLQPKDPAYSLLAECEAALEAGLFRDLPALICWGLRDFVLTESFLERWTKLWPQAEVQRFADCGHFVLEDANAEIGAHVERFLAAHPLSEAPPHPPGSGPGDAA